MGTNYEIDISKLNGEELLGFDDILVDIIAFNSDEEDAMDTICREIEELHEKWYHDYEKSHNYHASSGPDYDSDKAWMYAQTRLVNKHLNALDNDKIGMFFNCRGGLDSTESEELWKKCVTETEIKERPQYNYCDRYDFGSWNR